VVLATCLNRKNTLFLPYAMFWGNFFGFIFGIAAFMQLPHAPALFGGGVHGITGQGLGLY